jgi:hypothetical protein
MRALLALVLALSACNSSPPEPGGSAEEGATEPPAAYDGPDLVAKVETEESQPPRHILVVEVNCPTGGYEFALASYDGESDPREARFVLTSPASDEMVIQAFQLHTQRIDLGSSPTPVRVLVSQRQRRSAGPRPPFQLAATATPH